MTKRTKETLAIMAAIKARPQPPIDYASIGVSPKEMADRDYGWIA